MFGIWPNTYAHISDTSYVNYCRRPYGPIQIHYSVSGRLVWRRLCLWISRVRNVGGRHKPWASLQHDWDTRARDNSWLHLRPPNKLVAWHSWLRLVSNRLIHPTSLRSYQAAPPTQPVIGVVRLLDRLEIADLGIASEKIIISNARPKVPFWSIYGTVIF